jgi:rSAM/selenodomain-associated transferase 2
MSISIIIPTFNEAQRIQKLVNHLLENSTDDLLEIIVSDAAQSSDNTVAILQGIPKVQVFRAEATSRARQMNQAAALARGKILYFVHADVWPPTSYLSAINKALKPGNDFGFFSYQFDSGHPLLRLNGYFTRFNGIFTGGGDQTFFIRASIFKQMNGFKEDLVIMEDFEMFWRLKKTNIPYTIIRQDVRVSARKYEHNSYLKVSLVNFCTFFLFRMGYCPVKLKAFYSRSLKNKSS